MSETEYDLERELEDLPLLVENLVFTVKSLNATAAKLSGEELSAEEIATYIQTLRIVQRWIKDVDQLLENHLVPLLPRSKVALAGIGVVEKSPNNTREWDTEALLPVILAKASDERYIDRETGEALESEAQAFLRVLKECVNFGYFKIGGADGRKGLKDHGIDPDYFSEKKSGRVTVKVPLDVQL